MRKTRSTHVWLGMATFVVANVTAISGQETARPPVPAKPDVLVVICDQWNPRCVSWDDAQVHTPNLAGIAREGLIFDRCYTNSPVCMPARVSLITGWCPHNHGLWGNANDYHLPAAMAPMFRDIHGAGLTTAQIGKLHWFTGGNWHQDFPTIDDYCRAMGLDIVTSISGPPDAEGGHDLYTQYLEKRGLLGAVARDQLRRLRESEYEARPATVDPEDYHDTFVTGIADEFIRKQPRDKPMCLVVSLHSPHPPLDAPGKYATMFDPEDLALPANVPEHFNYDRHVFDQADVRRMLANYLGKMALCDDCIGRLIDAMKARGTWDQCLFIFTSDHGEMMGSHGALSKGRFWEESARVPLVVRWPGHVRTGRTPALVQLFDVYPTIVEAVGGTLSPGRFAQSFLPVATGKATSARELAVSEIGMAPPLGMMIRDARYKWWADNDHNRESEHLFDLDSDPLEQIDLAPNPDHHDLLEKMRERALTWLRSTQVNLAEGSKSRVQRAREAGQKDSQTK